jgi:hypothetical protein
LLPAAIVHPDWSIAKHLEQLKGGRFPLEVLVRGKDAAENEKLFIKIADTIKASGVRRIFSIITRHVLSGIDALMNYIE